jgi:hypothetical protein
MKVMKRTIIITQILLYIGSLIGFLSCNESFDEIIVEPDSCNLKLDVEMNQNQADLTRSVITGSRFPSDAQLGIYVKYTQNKYLANNLVANRSNDSWKLETPFKLDSYTENDSLTIYAYYPHSSSTQRGLSDSITIDINPVGTMGQPDYLYGSSHGINRINSTAKIRFKHALSLISLNIINPNADNVTITNVRVENDSIFGYRNPTKNQYVGLGSYFGTSGKMDLESGNISRLYDPNAVMNLSESTEVQPGNSATIDVLVMPNKSCAMIVFLSDSTSNLVTRTTRIRGGIVFTVTTDVGESKLRIDSPIWKQGYQYLYNIVLDTIPKNN